jgi:hypothetical protein
MGARQYAASVGSNGKRIMRRRNSVKVIVPRCQTGSLKVPNTSPKAVSRGSTSPIRGPTPVVGQGCERALYSLRFHYAP